MKRIKLENQVVESRLCAARSKKQALGAHTEG